MKISLDSSVHFEDHKDTCGRVEEKRGCRRATKVAAGQPKPAISGAALLARRIRARQAFRAADPDVRHDLDARPAAVYPTGLARRRRLVHPEPAHRQCYLPRLLDLDSA